MAKEDEVLTGHVQVEIDLRGVSLQNRDVISLDVDHTRACRIGETFAISCYQYDIQTLVDRLSSEEPGVINRASAVSKMRFSRASFNQLLNEIVLLAIKAEVLTGATLMDAAQSAILEKAAEVKAAEVKAAKAKAAKAKAAEAKAAEAKAAEAKAAEAKAAEAKDA